MTNEQIGARIRAIRTEAGMTMEALGIAVGLSFQQVGKYERGVDRISAAKLAEVAKALKRPITDFYPKARP